MSTSSENENAPPRTPLTSIPDPSQFPPTPSHFDSILKNNPLHTYAPPAKTLSIRHGKPLSDQNSPARTTTKPPASARNTPFTKGKHLHTLSRGMPIHHSPDFLPHFDLSEDPSFWEDHNVQVLIRIRPLNSMETVIQGYGRCLKQDTSQTLVWLGHPETKFTFDHVACETVSQEKLFRAIGLPMVENCMSGYNSCMFAYGQTGSGKTYTMMGEINQLEDKLNEDSGITPRIFDCLFSRIRMEEENRRNEKLRFSCKCSFLEIYNEQITDLLEPSSTNLQLREDSRKGVYVENLTEYDVTTVIDVTKLLSQGAANRKIAATNMNSESSRSHSVFTCIIESRWEKDSMTHFRFARLNLVDLAGSERQKHSGAEGDRLKEAANINKSLSTLGLVIMSLVDLAHGKHRHVPYRDSRLTFLLQDSLGGNSKTTIIANVSPSICSAHETLSTLKFAQRAKLIQNNAKVNEDASGDVNTLQLQIQQLKDQLSFIIKHHNLSASLSRCPTNFEESSLASFPHLTNSSKEKKSADNNLIGIAHEKMKSMEATILSALRREKIAEMELQKLEARFDHINRFACQIEEELQQTKLMLRLREARIKHLEFSVEGSSPSEHFLVDENKALKEEIQLLQARIDKNPELTRFALENLRLLEQLQVFQNFYEQGERETLLAETSELRDQLLDILERKTDFSKYENQDRNILEELEECRNMNSKLTREVENLKAELEKYSSCTQASFDNVTDYFLDDSEEIIHPREAKTNACKSYLNKYSWFKSESTESECGGEMASNSKAVDVDVENKNNEKTSASVIQPIDTQLLLIQKQSNSLEMQGIEEMNITDLQAKLGKLIEDLERAKSLNCKYREDRASQLLQQHQVELIREQVETETAKTIIHLQEEATALQLELNEKLCCMTQENVKLGNIIEAKEEQMRMLCGEWERATFELTSFLVEGSKSLEDASGQIESIVCSFPHVIREHVETAARACIYKEEAILRLEKSLEDAQTMVTEMELKLNSLKEATIFFNEFPERDGDQSRKETINIDVLLNEKNATIKVLESQLKSKAYELLEAGKRTEAALVVVKWLSDCNNLSPSTDTRRDNCISGVVSPTMEDIQALIGLETFVMESENAINASFMDVEVHITALQRVIVEDSATYMNCVKVMVNEIQEMRSKFIELKNKYLSFPSSKLRCQASDSHTVQHLENQHILHSVRNEIAKVNYRLQIFQDHLSQNVNAHSYLVMDEYLAEADNWSSENSLSSGSTSCSDFSIENNQLDGLSHACCPNFSGRITEHMVDLKWKNCSLAEFVSGGLKKPLKKLHQNEAVASCLRKEIDLAFDAFNKLYAHLAPIIDEHNDVDICYPGGIYKSFGSRMETAEASAPSDQEVVSDNKVNHHVHSRTFLCKYEEARTTMKEADIMVNALLKANENARELNCKWRQACEQLIVERSQLIEENEQLKAAIKWKDDETKSQLDKIHHCLIEVEKYTSQFEVCFLQIQGEVDKSYKALCSDLLCMGEEMLQFFCNSRSSLDDIFSEIMKNEFAHYIMYQCVVGQIIQTIPSFNVENHLSGQQKFSKVMNISAEVNNEEDFVLTSEKMAGEKELVKDLEGGTLGISYDTAMYENFSLRKELERKETLLKGLHFDFSLLQEAASKRKDIKDETEKLILALSDVRHELEMRTSQFDSLLVQYQKVEGHLADTKEALCISNCDLSRAKERIDTLSNQNADLRMFVKDLYLQKSEDEEQLKEQEEAVRGLEEEIIYLSSSVENKIRSSVESLEEDLKKAADERDQLREEICSLKDKLDIAYALADENEAIAVESRQESEASKLYAEQKEEEVKILEHSVEELESTINVLETKVYEMNDEVETHRLARESLELELQALRQRLLTVENSTDVMDPENTISLKEDPISRQFHNKLSELHEAHNQIRCLEQSGAEKDEEIKKFKEYISELVLHSEAQASQYQKKYKTLEAMVQEVKTNLSSSASGVPTLDKSEKSSMRTRGSNSPFRCISNLVQQMNLERDQELSAARLRVEELEAMLAAQQKEICKLNARLAAAESMTHDIIRDLLGVKLDMTNYANLIDQHQVQRLLEAAHQQSEEFVAKEHQILNLKRQISILMKEKESCVSEITTKAADLLASHMSLEQLQERDQLLSAQNEMLKMDKTNLLRKVAELDDMVKTLLPTRSSQQRIKRSSKTKENGMQKMDDASISERLAHSEKLLSRVNGELAQYQKSSSSRPLFN